jgi:hypothetical protein
MNAWLSKGLVIKLRREIYALNEDDRKTGLSKKLVGNILYSPSYISLEFALSYYDVIPEAVYTVTSVTTRKTQRFSNMIGDIKKDAFFGFQELKDEFGFDCLFAMPEKALLDYFYLNIPAYMTIGDSFFEESLRLQNMDMIDFKKLLEMSELMNCRKMTKIVAVLKKWANK